MSDDLEFDQQIIRDIKAGGSARRKRFDEFERKHKDKLGNGKDGWEIYESLFSYVEDSGSEEAKKEFRDRFMKFVDRKYVASLLFDALPGALEKVAEIERAKLDKEERDELNRLRAERRKKKWWQVWK